MWAATWRANPLVKHHLPPVVSSPVDGWIQIFPADWRLGAGHVAAKVFARSERNGTPADGASTWADD